MTTDPNLVGKTLSQTLRALKARGAQRNSLAGHRNRPGVHAATSCRLAIRADRASVGVRHIKPRQHARGHQGGREYRPERLVSVAVPGAPCRHMSSSPRSAAAGISVPGA